MSLKPLVIVLVATVTACSFVMRTGGFEPPARPYCHRWVHPIADTLVAGAAASAAVGLELDDRERDEDGDDDALSDNTLLAVMLAGVSVLYAVSAVVGYKRSLRCTDEHRAYERWRREHPETATSGR